MADEKDDYAKLIPGAAATPEGPDEYSKLVPEPLTREQEIRRDRLQRLLAANPNPGYTERFKDQVTSGLMRPIGGGMSVTLGLGSELMGGKPATIGEYWRGGVGAEEDFIHQAEKNTKGPLGTAVDFAGSLIGGGKATKALSLGKQALQSAVQGGIEGAARNADSWGSALKGSAFGSALGAGSSAVLGALTDRLGRVVNAKKDIGLASQGGNSQTLGIEGSAIYKKLDDAGIHYSARETAPLTGNVIQRLIDEGFDPTLHKKLLPALEDIGNLSGNRATWTQLQNLRTQISDLKASDNSRLRRIAGDLGDEVDNFIRTAKPTVPARSVGINPAQEVEQARSLWAGQSKARKYEALAEKGTRLADDPTAKVQKNFETHQDKFLDGKKYNPASPSQTRLMDEIVHGDPRLAKGADVADALAKRLAQFGALGAAGVALGPATGLYDITDKTGGTIAGTLAAAAALKAGGSTARQMIAERGAARVNDLIRDVVTEATGKGPGNYVPRDALARLLASQDLKRGIGNYAASYADKEVPQ